MRVPCTIACAAPILSARRVADVRPAILGTDDRSEQTAPLEPEAVEEGTPEKKSKSHSKKRVPTKKTTKKVAVESFRILDPAAHLRKIAGIPAIETLDLTDDTMAA